MKTYLLEQTQFLETDGIDAYYVIDPNTRERLGALSRQAKSDDWLYQDLEGQEQDIFDLAPECSDFRVRLETLVFFESPDDADVWDNQL